MLMLVVNSHVTPAVDVNASVHARALFMQVLVVRRILILF